MFGVYTKHHRLAVGDHVLAMMDEQQHMYLPGWIAGIVGDKINIKFCEGSLYVFIFYYMFIFIDCL